MTAVKHEPLVEPLDPNSETGRRVSKHLAIVLPRIEANIAARKARATREAAETARREQPLDG